MPLTGWDELALVGFGVAGVGWSWGALNAVEGFNIAGWHPFGGSSKPQNPVIIDVTPLANALGSPGYRGYKMEDICTSVGGAMMLVGGLKCSFNSTAKALLILLGVFSLLLSTYAVLFGGLM